MKEALFVIVVLIDGKMSMTLVDAMLLKSNQNQADKLMRMLHDTGCEVFKH